MTICTLARLGLDYTVSPTMRAYDWIKPCIFKAYDYLKPFPKRALLNLVQDVLTNLVDRAIAASEAADQWTEAGCARACAGA